MLISLKEARILNFIDNQYLEKAEQVLLSTLRIDVNDWENESKKMNI